MAQDGASKKVSAVLEKKGAANEDLTAIRKEAEETNSTVDKMATLVSQEAMEYMLQNRITLITNVTGKLKKILYKARPRKKRSAMCPIVGATLKFHKDDDVYPSDAELHNKEM